MIISNGDWFCGASKRERSGPPVPEPKHFFLRRGIQVALDALTKIVSRFTAANVAAKHGAFYAMSPRRVQKSLGLWREQMPTIQPYYAVKCNPDPNLLRTLFSSSVNFDCASERELLEIKKLALGTLSNRVVYANPCKSLRDIAAAKEMGIPTTVVDSEEEVEKLAAAGYSRGVGTAFAVGALVRIAVDDTASAMPFSTKFGCSIEDVQRIASAAERLRIPLQGVSFHVGSGCSDGKAYSDAIQRAYSVILNLRAFGHTNASIIDIGGGFKANVGDFKKKAFAIRCEQVNVARAEEGRGRGGGMGGGMGGDLQSSVKFIAEPGRFFAESAFDLFVQVIGKKRATGTERGAAKDVTWSYTLDDSLYGQFSGILFDYAKPTWVRVRAPGERGSRPKSRGILFGRTCDSVDVIARSQSMEELNVGDWLWFPNMGAYARATASEFNGFPTPPVILENELPVDPEELDYAKPTCIERMPPVSARAFWEKGGSAGIPKLS